MEIRTRQEALAILGLEGSASTSQIKSAYRNLSKTYHPDVASSEIAWQYNDIKDAYEFLQNEPDVDGQKILGQDSVNSSDRVSVSASARMRQSKKAGQEMAKARQNEKQRKKERQEELVRKAQELHRAEEEAQRKKEEVTQEALEHIKAIRMAEMISEMLENK